MLREPTMSSATEPASSLMMFVLIYLRDDLPLGFEFAQYRFICSAMPFRHKLTSALELRHLRYFLAVGEASSFTKAAAQLRVAQPALSRRVQDLEDEIGVDLLRRSPRGVTLTAEGKLYLEEVRELLKRTDESVEKVRAVARGEYGELHIG
jgi:DNA-binding MarR family transcriptional regulator